MILISVLFKEDTKISLKIIDHNVHTFQMDFTDKNEYIEIRKNDYVVELNNSDN